MWPASALLTGNGVAFVLRVPGHRARRLVEHERRVDLRGHVRRRAPLQVPDPRSRAGTSSTRRTSGSCSASCCSASSGPTRSRCGGGRCRPRSSSPSRSSSSGAPRSSGGCTSSASPSGSGSHSPPGIGVLAASGHTMTAAWHVGPIEGAEFWWLLVSSPEILVFLFFMITDPKTIPASRRGRLVYAVAVGLLATVLIAPFTTEFATKVAILGALFAVCARARRARARRDGAARRPAPRRPRRRGRGDGGVRGCARLRGARRGRGHPGAPGCRPPRPREHPRRCRRSRWSTRRESRRSTSPTAQHIARDVMTDLRIEAEALERRDRDRAADGASGEWLAVLWQQIDVGAVAAAHDFDSIELSLLPGDDQGPPTVVARLAGNDMAAQDGRARARERALSHRRAPRAAPRPRSPRRRRRASSEGSRSRRRRGGRPRLPPRRVPLRRLERLDRDDGRRALLARLRLATAGSISSS